MKIREPVNGIIFDLDGTLYRMPWYMKPLITIRLFPHCLRLPAYMSVRDKFAGKDMTDGKTLMAGLSEKLSNKIGSINPEQAKKWIFDAFYRQFESVMPLFRKSRPGVCETLAALRKKEIKLAVLSDFDRVRNRLLQLDITPELFDTLKAAEAEGCLKPCPRAFLDIARQWSFSPETILVIGDRDDTDGIAAKNAGMQFLRISDAKKLPAYAYNWKQVKDILVNLAQKKK